MQLALIANMFELFVAIGHMHCSKRVCLNIQTTAATYQNITHGYISNFLKGVAIQYELAVATRLFYGVILSQSRSLCSVSMHMMHRCAEIHNMMLQLTRNANKTSENHCELGVARITRDMKDLQTTHSWFTENYPFSEKAELIFISKGFTTPEDSDIGCDK